MGSLARLHRSHLWIALLSVALLAPSADADNAALIEARTARSALNYPTMIGAAERALRTPGNTQAELEEIYQMLGTGYGATRQKDKAIAAFRNLLAINPGFKLPGGQPPKIRRPYQEAGSFLFDSPQGLTLSVSSDSQQADGSSDVAVTARVADPVAVAKKAVLSFTSAGGEANTLEQPVSATVRLVIPKSELQPGTNDRAVTYNVTLVDEFGGTLRSFDGRITVPAKVVDLTVKKAPQPEKNAIVATTNSSSGDDDDARPVYKKWWFWAVVGGSAAVLAGGGIWLGTRGSDGVDLSVTTEVR